MFLCKNQSNFPTHKNGVTKHLVVAVVADAPPPSSPNPQTEKISFFRVPPHGTDDISRHLIPQ